MNFKYKHGFLILENEFLIVEKNTVFSNIQNLCFNIRNYL